MNGKRFEELDGLRGAAAAIVLVHHTVLTLPAFSDFALSGAPPHGRLEHLLFRTPLSLLWDGRAAVMVFFVLSGFVLSIPWLNRAAPAYPAYLVRRIFRIYVPYLIVVLAALTGVAAASLAPISGVSHWFQESWRAPITEKTLLAHILMTGEDNTVDPPIWGLIWEMRISVLFPLLVLPLARWRGMGAIGVIGFLTLAYPLANRASGAPPSPFGAPEALFWGLFFAWGATTALYSKDIARWLGRAHLALPVLAIALILLSHTFMWLLNPLWPYTPHHADLYQMFGAVALICAAITPGVFQNTLRLPLFAWLGRISYSLYLTHVPIILLLIYAFHTLAPLPVILIAAPFVALACATIINKILERPSDEIGRALSGRIRSAFGHARPAGAA